MRFRRIGTPKGDGKKVSDFKRWKPLAEKSLLALAMVGALAACEGKKTEIVVIPGEDGPVASYDALDLAKAVCPQQSEQDGAFVVEETNPSILRTGKDKTAIAYARDVSDGVLSGDGILFGLTKDPESEEVLVDQFNADGEKLNAEPGRLTPVDVADAKREECEELLYQAEFLAEQLGQGDGRVTEATEKADACLEELSQMNLWASNVSQKGDVRQIAVCSAKEGLDVAAPEAIVELPTE